jgi:hypothetical protein
MLVIHPLSFSNHFFFHHGDMYGGAAKSDAPQL